MRRGACLWVALVLTTTGCGTLPAAPGAPGPTTQVSASPAAAAAPAAAPSRVAGPLMMAASVPLRVTIPAIGVDSELMALGLQADGNMEVPPGGFPAGWFDQAPTPGELGPAVIAGHVDWAGPGVFHDLARLAVGDEVRVTRTDGTAPVFVVTAVEEHPKDQFPSSAVYGDIDHAGLRLITCGGEWDPTVRHYEANVVVFAELVRPG